MPLDWSHGPLAEGLACYRNREFFLAHEHWEAVWLGASEPEKTFLQSLIQVAAAFHHLERGNRIGAASLLNRSLRRLDAFPGEYGGIDVDALCTALRAWVQALNTGDRIAGQTHPHIL